MSKSNLFFPLTALLASISAGAADTALPAPSTAQPVIAFVCEHGSAKSMIAAAYFNRLAEKNALPIRAISRGLTLDAHLQNATRTGLINDGINTADLLPQQLAPMDAQQALQIISIGIEREPDYLRTDKLREWDGVPSVSKDYGAARDDIVKRVQALIESLKTTQQ